jgi:hypothetical protein
MLIAGLSFVQSAYAQWDDMKPIAGAKMFFSDKPFSTGNAGNKSSFTSKDFIYGRLELPNQTLYNAFGMQRMKNRYYLRYRVSAFKDRDQKGTCNLWDYLLIKNGNEKNSRLNFDIIPEPAKATSVICGSEIFNTGVAAGPLYHIINRENFPENGTYTIKVRLFLEAYDDWGAKDELDKWPVADGEFTFHFTAQDVQVIKKNATAANEVITNTAFLIKKLPDYFYTSATVSECKNSCHFKKRFK